MGQVITFSVLVALLVAAGCRNTEPPARPPEPPAAPSSSAVPRLRPTSGLLPATSGESRNAPRFGDKGRLVVKAQ
jgi:hypothetical protein